MNVIKKFSTKDKKEKWGKKKYKKVKRMGWEWEGTKKIAESE